MNGDDKRKKDTRVTSRAFARLAATPDGKRALAFLDQVFGWNEAGPPEATAESPIHFWIGNRAVLKAIKDQISSGNRLLANPENDHEQDDDAPGHES